MKSKHYTIDKNKYIDQTTIILTKKMEGFKIKPKNNISYNGIEVNSMMIVKPILIEKLLKKKIKRKLDYYLKYIISNLEDDNSSDGNNDSSFRQALNDLSKFKEIIEYKYRKFLDDKYINILNKKISLLEHEIKTKIVFKQQLTTYKKEINIENNEELKGKKR